MQFSTFAILSALSMTSVFAKSSSTVSGTAAASTGTSGAVTVHVVKVGSSNGTLKYFPNNIKAAKGDMVQFQFAPANHTVTQSTFDQPCQPIALHSNNTGFFSGFMPVSASSTNVPTYTIMINSTTPMWIYCSQGKHCQNGMTMVINENTAANASRSLENYQALAKLSTVNLPGGSTGSSNSPSNSSSPSSGTTTSAAATTLATETATLASTAAGSDATASGTTGSEASATTSPARVTASSAANAQTLGSSAGLGLGGVLAIAMGLLL